MGTASASTGPVTAGVPDDLAGLSRPPGRPAAAAPLFRCAVAILGTSLPADHPTLTRVRESHVVLLGRAAEAPPPRARSPALPPASPPLAIMSVSARAGRWSRYGPGSSPTSASRSRA